MLAFAVLILALGAACEGTPATEATPTSTPDPTSEATPAPEATTTPEPTDAAAPEVTPTSEAAAAEIPCEGSGPRVCLVPLAGFDETLARSLARYLADLDIPAFSAPAVALEFTDLDPLRSQLPAEVAESRINAAYPTAVADPDVTVIGLTDFDIFIEARTFKWVFGMRGGESLVISSARMAEEAWGRDHDDALSDERLRKMLLRYVGLFHLGLEENQSPLTVLYEHLDGVTQLDAMLDGIMEPSELPQPSEAVAVWAQSFCSAAAANIADAIELQAYLNRSFDVSLPVEEARDVVIFFLFQAEESRITFAEGIELASPLAHAVPGSGPGMGDEIPAFHHLVETLNIDDLDVIRDIVRSAETAETTAELTALLVEMTVRIQANPDLERMLSDYRTLPAATFVALTNAGPCGVFAPAILLPNQPLI